VIEVRGPATRYGDVRARGDLSTAAVSRPATESIDVLVVGAGLAGVRKNGGGNS